MVTISTKELLLGVQDVFDRLDRLDEAADDLHPVWDDLGGLFAARERTVFAASAWAPFAAVTLRTHQSPLVDTGVMLQGLSAARPIWARDHGAAYGAAKSDRRVFNVAVFHTYGTKHMPARIPVPRLRAAERRTWTEAVHRHLKRAL